MRKQISGAKHRERLHRTVARQRGDRGKTRSVSGRVRSKKLFLNEWIFSTGSHGGKTWCIIGIANLFQLQLSPTGSLAFEGYGVGWLQLESGYQV